MPTDVVECHLCLKDGSSLLLQANVLDHLTEPIRRGAVPSGDVSFLQALPPHQLADSLPLENNKDEIDILISADYVWDILSGDKLTLPSGLYLLSSRLGYVLNGQYLTKADDRLDSQQPDAGVTLCHTLVASQPTNHIEQFLELDTIGINDLATPSSDDVAVTHQHHSVQ